MANRPAEIINPTRSSSKHAFREALKEALNDLYDKSASTNIHRLYDTLARQLANVDIELKSALSDQWISVEKSNERVERGFGRYDRLIEEGAFDLSYIGLVPENTTAVQRVDLSAGDDFIVLDRLPASNSSTGFSLVFQGENVSSIIQGYVPSENKVLIDPPEEGGSYQLTYKDRGCTLARSEILPLERNEDGRLVAVVEGVNLLFDSERIFIQNSAIGVLIRDQDYTIDYKTGKITSTADGRIELLDPEALDISYRFCFDFSKQTGTAFHKQIYNEVATVLDSRRLKVDSTNVSEVFRVFNTTTRETLEPRVVSRGEIQLSQNDDIPSIARRNQSTEVVRTTVEKGLIVRDLSIPIQEGESRYSIQTVSNPKSVTRQIRLREGQREQIPTRINLNVAFETKDIVIKTGGLTAKRSNRLLLQGRHYSLTSSSPSEFSLFFLQEGLDIIGDNSVYVEFVSSLSAYQQENIPSERRFAFKIRTNPHNELFPVTGSTILLPDAYTYVEPGSNGDVRLKEDLVVASADTRTVFLEGVDYTYDGINKVISINPTSAIRQQDQVRVYFLGVQDYIADYISVPDVITVDYDTTRNAVDWSPSLKTFKVELRRTLTPDDNSIQLNYHPDDPFDLPTIEIRSLTDPRVRLRPVTYDRRQRLLIVEAPTQEDEFLITYTGHRHIVAPGVPYYVSYSYGGRDRALRNVWAPLLGLTETERRRFEDKNLNSNDTRVVLDYPLVDLNEAIIFLKGESEEDSATTITGYDPETNALTFTPLRQYGTYTIAYNTPNALTEDLRKFVIGLIEAFLLGPTKRGIERMIETFTGITPRISVATSLAFRLVDEMFNDDPSRRSDRLNDVGFTANNPDFVPSRFNNGYKSTQLADNVLYAPAITNVRNTEGTIQFLIGPRFNGDDGFTKYFVDIGIPGQYYRNRMSVYKNSRNYLVFETHDSEGAIWRVASDISRNRTTINRFLKKGTTSLRLPVRPSFATTDLDNDGQYDYFGAHKTEFIIKRVPGEQTEEGYGYGYGLVAGYGYRGDILLGANLDVSSPLNIGVHFRVPEKLFYTTRSGFDDVTRKLQATAQQVKANGGRLIVHTSPAYIQANVNHTNVLKSLQDSGCEIGLYIDFPSYLTERADRSNYLKQAFDNANTLGIAFASASGNPEISDWSNYANDRGLIITAGYVDPITDETFDNRSPIVRRVRLSETFGLLDSGVGQLLYLPGVTYLNYSTPFSALTLQQIEATLHRAITMNDVSKIASWYFTLTPESFSEDYLNETALIGSWIVDTIAPLTEQNKVRWSSFEDVGEIYFALENFLSSLDAADALTVGNDSSIKPLTYDFDTNTITFEPIPSDGIYEFDYVTGWSAYEESEIFVAAVYKFRTDDESLPFYKLYINGELQEFVTFADFPAAGEG